MQKKSCLLQQKLTVNHLEIVNKEKNFLLDTPFLPWVKITDDKIANKIIEFNVPAIIDDNKFRKLIIAKNNKTFADDTSAESVTQS